MRRFSSLLVSLVVAVGLSVSPFRAPPAAAADTDLILVANRYNGSGCATSNFRLFIFNLATKAWTNLGQPPIPNLAEFTEAKPIDLNRRILALWGGSAGQKGGVGIYDRTATPPRWTKSFELPAAFELPTDGRNAHSITLLPKNNPDDANEPEHFAIAHVGKLNGAGSGWVVVVDDTGLIKDSEQLTSAHGVEWDPVRQRVFAVGMSQIGKYTYDKSSKQLNPVTPFVTLPAKPSNGAAANGHDLRRRRSANNYHVTADEEAWIFDPDTGGLSEIGNNLGGVKSMDESFDGRTEYNYMNGTEARFLGTTPWVSWNNGCIKPYKAGRFIWSPGQKVYSDDPIPDPDPDPVPTGYDPSLTVGANSGTWWIEVFAGPDVTSVDAIGNNGTFYINLPRTTWGSFAKSPPVQLLAGQNIQLIARRSSDGASAATDPFPWLQEYSPDVKPGWNASIARGANCSTTWVEMVVSAGATSVAVKHGTQGWTELTYRPEWGKWVKAMNIASGTKVVVRAVRADTSTAYSPIFTWMQ